MFTGNWDEIAMFEIELSFRDQAENPGCFVLGAARAAPGLRFAAVLYRVGTGTKGTKPFASLAQLHAAGLG